MSLSFTGLEKLEGGQQGIEGFFGNKPITGGSPIKSEPLKRQRSFSPSTSIVPILQSNSEASPKKKPRLPTLQSGSLRNKTGLDSFLSKNGESSSSSSSRNERWISPVIIDDDEIEITLPKTEEDGRIGQWTCPKCEFKTAQGLDEASLKGEKQEHEDFHFAQDLQNGISPVRPKVIPGTGPKKKKKVEGIKAFFTAKPAKKE